MNLVINQLALGYFLLLPFGMIGGMFLIKLLRGVKMTIAEAVIMIISLIIAAFGASLCFT